MVGAEGVQLKKIAELTRIVFEFVPAQFEVIRKRTVLAAWNWR